jgi:hypothetical protein
MSRRRGALAALLTAGALIAPAALAAPAHATTDSGCTITPHNPRATGDLTGSGAKKVEYKVDITCSAGRSVYVTQERWEEDNFSLDDKQGTTHWNDIHFSTKSTVTKSTVKPLPTDGVGEGENYAEVYQRVNFYVVSDDVPPIVSSTTPWDYSSTISIHE